MRSTVTDQQTVELSLVSKPVPQPKDDEVVVRIEATPLNPSDLAQLLAFADTSKGVTTGTASETRFTAPLTEESSTAVTTRKGAPLKCGNEGAGTVVLAGPDEAAQNLLGKRVTMMDGALYCQFRKLRANQCVPLEEDTTPAQAAACFVNPLTALGMVETSRLGNFQGIVHTAAASTLGLMLNRLCLKEGIALVNVVRRSAQADLLRSEGAKHVVDSSSENYQNDLADAIHEANAYVAFDAVGGGDYINDILCAMEVAARRDSIANGPYGTNVFKQVYVYGRLDTRKFAVDLGIGFSWSVQGFLLPELLSKLDPGRVAQLRHRAVSEIKTTFHTHYANEISLVDALQSVNVQNYSKSGTGEKYLINPSLD